MKRATLLTFTIALVLLLSPAVLADATAVQNAKRAIEGESLAPANVVENSDGIDASFTLKKGYTAEDVSKNAVLVLTILFEEFPTAKEYRVTMRSEGVALVRFTTTPAVMDNLYFGTMNSNGFWGSVEYELLPEQTASSESSSGGVLAVILFFFVSFGVFIVLGVGAIIALWLIFRKKK